MFRLRRSAVPAVLLVSVIGGRLHFDGSRRAVRAAGYSPPPPAARDLALQHGK